MRIQRSLRFITCQLARTFFRKTTAAIVGSMTVITIAVVSQNIIHTPNISYAATADSCFEFNASTGTITGYAFQQTGCPSDVEIPSQIGGVAVTSIGRYSFSYGQLHSVVIPEGITTIGDNAFFATMNRNNQPVSLTIPSSVTTIGENAFRSDHLTSLTFTSPSKLTSIGNYAFAMNELHAVTIPSTTTTIGLAAFYSNQLESIVIPNSVSYLGDYSFETNQLTSLTLGNGVDSLNRESFAANKLQTVTIPDTITSIDPTTFMGQTKWGGLIDTSSDPDPNWYSLNPSVSKQVYDNIWYVQLRTASSNNPNHLTDESTGEEYYYYDLNADGDYGDSAGGHLINPATVAVQYIDGRGASLLPSSTVMGQLDNGTNLTDYLVKNVDVPAMADSEYPTPEEQAADISSLGKYYHQGQQVTLGAPSVPGYSLLHPASPYTSLLTDFTTNLAFTYGTTPVIVTQPPSSVPAPSTSPTITKPATRPTTTPTPVSSPIEPSSEPAVADPAQSEIDFTTPSGSRTNPTAASVPQGLSPLMADSRLTVDTTKACHQIDSASLLSPMSFVTPNTNYETIGGLAFVIGCNQVAGDASVTLTLGDSIKDVSAVKIYKQDTHGISTDITNQITITNQVTSAGTRTVISYSLRDGQSLDDDGVANSSISDPIYISVPHTNVSSSSITDKKSASWGRAVLIGGGVLVAIVATIAIIAKKRHGSNAR